MSLTLSLFNTLQPEVTRRQASLQGTYQLSDKLQASTEVLYSYNDSAMIFGTPLTVGPGLRAYRSSQQYFDRYHSGFACRSSG